MAVFNSPSHAKKGVDEKLRDVTDEALQTVHEKARKGFTEANPDAMPQEIYNIVDTSKLSC